MISTISVGLARTVGSFFNAPDDSSNHPFALSSSYEDILFRVENYVSKYFLEFIEVFYPSNLYQTVCLLAKMTYWDIQESYFDSWFQDFRQRVHLIQTIPLFSGKAEIASKEFIDSSQFQKLKEIFPAIDRIETDEGLFAELDIQGGTCFGQSLIAMKYESRFNTVVGFRGIDAPDSSLVKNEVIFLQELQHIKKIFKWVLKLQNEMENRHINVNDLSSLEHGVDKARLFHYLRMVNTSRAEARYLTEILADCFLHSSTELQSKIERCDEMVRQSVVSNARQLNPKLFSNRSRFTQTTQQELDGSVRRFLRQNTGCFSLICAGEMKIGHAMFIKIEEGKCVTFDPCEKICFITEHTVDGIDKTLELMKKLVLRANLGGNVFYKVMGVGPLSH